MSDDPFHLTRQDRIENGEHRWQTLGIVGGVLLLLFAHTWNEPDQIRIISARGKFYRPIKKQLIVRIDADVVAWLKSQGKGYQGRLNNLLRAAMLEKLGHN